MLPFIEIASAAHAPAKPVGTRASRHAQACARAYRNYNAKTNSYRDASGKQRRCTL